MVQRIPKLEKNEGVRPCSLRVNFSLSKKFTARKIHHFGILNIANFA